MTASPAYLPPSMQWYTSVLAQSGGAEVPFAFSAVSAAARLAVEMAGGGVAVAGVALTVEEVPGQLEIIGARCEQEEGVPDDCPLPPLPVLSRRMRCLNIGAEGLAGALRVPAALEHVWWWVERCAAAAVSVPLSVRCSAAVVTEVGRRFLSRLRAGDVARLRVVGATARRATVLETQADKDAPPTAVCLGPALASRGAAAWHQGLEELQVLAGPKLSGVVLDEEGEGAEAGVVPYVAASVRRLVVRYATAVDWIAQFESLEELVVEASVGPVDFAALAEALPALRRVSLYEVSTPWLAWLKDLPRLFEVDLQKITGVKDWQSLGRCRSLRRLTLSHCRLTDLRWAKQCRQLEVLQVVRVPRLRDLSHLCELSQLTFAAIRFFEASPGEFPSRSTALRTLFVSPSGAGYLSEDRLLRLPETLTTLSFRTAEEKATDAEGGGGGGEPWFAHLRALEELRVHVTADWHGAEGAVGAPLPAAGHLLLSLGCISLSHRSSLAGVALPRTLRRLRLQSLAIPAGGACGDGLVALLATAPALESLTLSGCSGIENLGGLCTALPRLRTLEFLGCDMTVEPTWVGADGGSAALETLVIDGSSVSMNLEPLRRLPALKSLLYYSYYSATPYDTEEAAGSVVVFPVAWLRPLEGRLERLSLELITSWVPDDEAAFGRMPRLRSLTLGHYGGASLRWLSACTALREFALCVARVERDWDALRALTCLEHLRLLYTRFEDYGVLTGCNMLRTLRTTSDAPEALLDSCSGGGPPPLPRLQRLTHIYDAEKEGPLLMRLPSLEPQQERW